MTVPSVKLNSGTNIPQLGLGVWQATIEQTAHAVHFALDEAGYRHIDTAAAYGNEQGVGQGLVLSSVDRSDVFVTTKLWNADHGYQSTLKAIDTSLRKLDSDYVDLYLIHWPLQDSDQLLRTWDAMEKIAEDGKARAIGVCNFEPHHLQLIIDRGGMIPAVDQVELHPHLQQRELREFAGHHDIAIESWSPLGGTPNSGWGPNSKPNTVLTDPTIAKIADKHGKSPAQIILAWHIRLDLIVIPKSVHDERIKENIDVFDFSLDDDDMAKIAALDTGERVGTHPDEMNIDAPK
ncbi:aldo/keto reductase [Gordonia jinhuaensis]|uniref:Oxidoreductase n=1 Tax=Gordonia jinhuaensis TaxID=1517702 RepID=A0A916SUN6_9ACTN|nr:aldo/keto reductase [Gordonia jinhuaensis]GGB18477.1 oxidoreductase [Gordonia jinhuaensis]